MLRYIYIIVIILLINSCVSSPYKHTITNDEIKTTKEISQVVIETNKISDLANQSKELAKSGYKQSLEEHSKTKFKSIESNQKEILKSSKTITDKSDNILKYNNGKFELRFTYKILMWVIGIFVLMGILTYFGLDGLLRLLIKKLIVKPLEHILETNLFLANESNVNNENFSKEVQELINEKTKQNSK